MKKWLILLALLSPSVARANTITPAFTQGSMQSTTTTTQQVNETRQTQVFGGDYSSWSGTNITPSGDIDATTTFSVTDPTESFILETVSRSAGVVEQIDSTIVIDTTSTTTSLSVFSQ